MEQDQRYKHLFLLESDLIAASVFRSFMNTCFPSISFQHFTDPDQMSEMLVLLGETPTEAVAIFIDTAVDTTIVKANSAAESFLHAFEKMPEAIREKCKVHLISTALKPEWDDLLRKNEHVGKYGTFISKPISIKHLDGIFLRT